MVVVATAVLVRGDRGGDSSVVDDDGEDLGLFILILATVVVV